MMHSGEQTRIRSAAAGQILKRQTSLVIRQTIDGYEFASAGEAPVKCQSWPQARRILTRVGVPEHKIDVISSKLVVGSEITVRTRV